jgi:hypothetical protein
LSQCFLDFANDFFRLKVHEHLDLHVQPFIPVARGRRREQKVDDLLDEAEFRLGMRPLVFVDHPIDVRNRLVHALVEIGPHHGPGSQHRRGHGTDANWVGSHDPPRARVYDHFNRCLARLADDAIEFLFHDNDELAVPFGLRARSGRTG